MTFTEHGTFHGIGSFNLCNLLLNMEFFTR